VGRETGGEETLRRRRWLRGGVREAGEEWGWVARAVPSNTQTPTSMRCYHSGSAGAPGKVKAAGARLW
jgi:hypothetical protein